jgi:VanZ family protein
MSATPRYRYLKRALLYWLPLVLWMSWIYYLSDQPALPHPGREMGVSDDLFDYSAHAFTFGILACLLWRVLNTHTNTAFATNGAGLLAALYAASDEFHQSFVVGRYARLQDGAADLAGILLAVALLHLWQTKKKGSQVGKSPRAHLDKEKRGRRI